MEEFHISNFGELDATLRRYRKDASWIYRGQGNSKWPLIPSIGRSKYYSKLDESAYFNGWKSKAIEYLRNPPSRDLEWLAIAQQHGLATRLLDWTRNPLVAVFFALHGEYNSDCVVYAYKKTKKNISQDLKNPLKFKGIAVYRPSRVVPRLTRQNGVFTLHGPADLDITTSLSENDRLEKIIIKKASKFELLFDLNHYGVNQEMLFPDLDGLSSHYNWLTQNITFWMKYDGRNNTR